MNNDTSAEREGEEICHCICCWEVEGRVSVVCSFVKGIIIPQNTGDVVDLSETIIRFVSGYREVSQIPRLQEELISHKLGFDKLTSSYVSVV